MPPELLAPAGGMSQLRAALRFGADAVYGALPAFGLRAYAGNFTWDQLRDALDLTHRQYHKKFYLTLNILPYQDELPALIETAKRARDLGVDAALVADLGAFLALRREAPDLPLHISTQANTLNAEAARFYYDHGAERIVLARELSLSRIAALRKALPDALSLEAFVHGAMCMSYSGRCMLSDHLTGRGGNRGQCAQPCRWEYALVEKKRPGEYWPIEEDQRGTYLLSAYDLNMLSHLPELLAAGVSSLKIEGRMKTEYYVATVVGAYRRALDALEHGEDAYRAILPELEKELRKASHRPFNTGFYFGPPSPMAGAAGFSQEMEYVAQVESWRDGEALLRLKNRFYVGDTLELLSPQGVFAFPVSGITLPDTGEKRNTVSVAGQRVAIPLPYPAAAGDFLRGPNRNHQNSPGAQPPAAIKEEKPMTEQKVLIVVDMQNDFIDGSLGTQEAQAIVPAVAERIRAYRDAGLPVIATQDTHGDDYLNTREGRWLPVPHCIRGTKGWELREEIKPLLAGCPVVEKPTFGSIRLPGIVAGLAEGADRLSIELIGLCTDICVVSNALLLKAHFPEADLSVTATCCAGVTPEKHEASLETMRSCQIAVL